MTLAALKSFHPKLVNCGLNCMRLPDDSEIIIELEGTHPIPRPLTPVSPASFASPENVGDRVFVEHVMPKLDLNISSEPLSDWFQLGILNSRSGSHILSGNGSRVGSESGTSIVETSAGSQDNVGPSQSEESAVIKPALSAVRSTFVLTLYLLIINLCSRLLAL